MTILEVYSFKIITSIQRELLNCYFNINPNKPGHFGRRRTYTQVGKLRGMETSKVQLLIEDALLRIQEYMTETYPPRRRPAHKLFGCGIGHEDVTAESAFIGGVISRIEYDLLVDYFGFRWRQGEEIRKAAKPLSIKQIARRRKANIDWVESRIKDAIQHVHDYHKDHKDDETGD